MPKKKTNAEQGHETYTPRATFFLTLCVVVLLTGAQWLPAGDWSHGVDLYSDLTFQGVAEADAALERADLKARFNDDYAQQLRDSAEEPTELAVQPVAESAAASTVNGGTAHSASGHLNAVPSASARGNDPRRTLSTSSTDTVRTVATRAEPATVVDASGKSVTRIEDFSSSGNLLSLFLDKLKQARHQSRPVRIAVVGDSFIEGDIFTQDLRELLQTRFGGRGVGFVPITSQVAGFRQTVKHTFAGWSSASIVTQPGRGSYLLSSYLFSPTAGRSTASYKGSTSRRYLDYFSRARLLYLNKGDKAAKVEVQINSGQVQSFTAYPTAQLSQVVSVEDSIRSISYTVSGGEGGFVAYGVLLDEGRGVNVDNYSVRGNSGVSMASIDATLMMQLQEIQPIDMVIVQYGLNVAQADAKSYTLYQAQMQRVVSRLKQIMPGVAVLVLGIPDRTHRTANGWVTMPGVEAMARAQRSLAQSTGVLYWSTLDAMRSRGGMNKFVERGWAAKDYTHLSARGGREVGRALFDAMMYEIDQPQ